MPCGDASRRADSNPELVEVNTAVQIKSFQNVFCGPRRKQRADQGGLTNIVVGQWVATTSSHDRHGSAVDQQHGYPKQAETSGHLQTMVPVEHDEVLGFDHKAGSNLPPSDMNVQGIHDLPRARCFVRLQHVHRQKSWPKVHVSRVVKRR